ncbi:hypothetical protein [Enterococcus canintestini]|uniref:Uncharacterized protein n=1 Tax=Enterococcus canintestini TaxID=317010 RepID=A0A267HU12_9ENTE|nr:hypothetical protein [Enterococcus canintestini]PAB01836.1 hypothetical protein AKL21_02580 [Enterococcus canintestini]
MKLRRDILGVVLAFMSAGFVATGLNADAYQAVYDTQVKQEQKVQQAINSEFITSQDKKDLQQTVTNFTKIKNRENRSGLKEKINQQEKLLHKVNLRLVKKEAKVAAQEYQLVTADLTELNEKSQEPFITADDEAKVTALTNELAEITSPQKVKPVRTLASKTEKLATEMKANQAEMLEFVANLKEDNKIASDLQKHKFLTKNDKTELANLQKENEKYFLDADDLLVLKSHYDSSKSKVTTLKSRATATEQDFKENEKVVRELIKATNELLSKGDLNSDEKTELKQIRSVLNDALGLKNYQPGDLANNYTTLKTSYDNSYKVSSERQEKAKRLAAEAAARKKAAELKAAKEAQEKAERQKEAQAQTVANTPSNNETPTPIQTSAGWYQAPNGYKFLKVESGKTYGQVKNPGNFSLITVAQAANYTPGHGNGSAKQ